MPKWAKVLIIIILIIAIIAGAIIMYVSAKQAEEILDNVGTLNDKIESNGSSDDLEDIADRLDTMYIDMFNQQFMMFAGENLRGSTVKVLINKVETNNETSEHKVKLEGITKVDEIDSSAIYAAQESYGKDGMINKITITKN